ncbi:hypothetical protein, partial [Xanthomonas fragariae]|uniref:hypothetical protein n=1 Tax=Xanthomonas fragariae TaxID=48664 RepID=UPI001F1D1D38
MVQRRVACAAALRRAVANCRESLPPAHPAYRIVAPAHHWSMHPSFRLVPDNSKRSIRVYFRYYEIRPQVHPLSKPFDVQHVLASACAMRH